MNVTQLPKIVEIAYTQIGYLEKASNNDLDSFTANPGNNNYTKYGEWYGLNPAPYCAMFVSWCANQADEVEAIGKFASVQLHWDWFTARNETYPLSYTPVPGDIAFFDPLGSHEGIVSKIENGYIYIIEGNTTGPDGYRGVFEKAYAFGSSYLYGFAHPNYKNKTTNKNYIYAMVNCRRGKSNGFIHRTRIPRH